MVYDLGCGDGRIPIAAAKQFGARGVGVDIDPQRIAEANANAKKEGVTDRVTFLLQDALTTDVSDATVVTLYLLSASNLKLRPILTKQLKPGARIVSHAFSMGDWQADKVDTFTDSAGSRAPCICGRPTARSVHRDDLPRPARRTARRRGAARSDSTRSLAWARLGLFFAGVAILVVFGRGSAPWLALPLWPFCRCCSFTRGSSTRAIVCRGRWRSTSAAWRD